MPWDERPPVLAEKAAAALRRARTPKSATSTRRRVWAAGEVLQLRGNFNTYVTTQGPHQAGRADLPPPAAADPADRRSSRNSRRRASTRTTWKADLKEIADRLTETCRAVDPTSTEETIKKAHAADVVEGEEHAKAVTATAPSSRRQPRSRRRRTLRSGDL